MFKSNRNLKQYGAPTVERIVIDNDISLQLQSNPPAFESSNQIDTFNNQNPSGLA